MNDENGKKPTKPNTIKKNTLLAKYKESMGNVTAACEAAGVNRWTFYEWKKNDPDFAKAVEEINESSIDFAESKLKELMNEGNSTAIIFYLKTKGKGRGYVERVETDSHVEIGERKDGKDLLEYLKSGGRL